MWREVMWLVVMTRTLVSAGVLALLRNRCRAGLDGGAALLLPRWGPRGDEARRHRDWRVLGAELGGREPDDVAERPAERAEAGEADVPRDIGDRPVGLAEQSHRPLDAATLEVVVRRLAVDVL